MISIFCEKLFGADQKHGFHFNLARYLLFQLPKITETMDAGVLTLPCPAILAFGEIHAISPLYFGVHRFFYFFTQAGFQDQEPGAIRKQYLEHLLLQSGENRDTFQGHPGQEGRFDA